MRDGWSRLGERWTDILLIYRGAGVGVDNHQYLSDMRIQSF